MIELKLLQMNSKEALEDNMAEILSWVSNLEPVAHTRVLVFPECALSFASTADQLGEIGACEQRILSFWQSVARQSGSHIISGSVALRAEQADKFYNRSYHIAPDGDVVCHYDKLHLFDASVNDCTGVYKESLHYQAGQAACVTEVDGYKIGLSICYDLRFPELYQWQRAHGAQILIVMAAFTVPTGKAHWQPLLQARAIENQCVVAACAQSGHHQNGKHTYGHSMCIDSWGEVRALRQSGVGWLEFMVDGRQIRFSLP